MPTYQASVIIDDNIKGGERCAADREQLAAVGRDIMQQVRILKSTSEYALYTVAQEVPEGDPDDTVRMRKVGRERLGPNGAFTGTLDSQVPHPTFTDDEAERNNEFVERLKDNGINRGFIVIAPHGGEIERGSSELAELVHFLLTCELKIPSLWACKGFDGPTGAFDRWHITSTDIHEASFPELRKVISRGFRHAIAFHGYEPESNQPDILVGGTSPLKQEICKAIENAVADSVITVRLSTSADQFNGDSRQNIVNRLTANRAGGVQLEMSLRVRTDRDLSRFRLAIAQAVTQVYATRLRRFEGCRRRILGFLEIVDPVCVMRSIPFDPEQVICAIAAARGHPPRLPPRLRNLES